jgi:hypothetical protein
MNLKESGVRNGNPTLQNSRLLGIIDGAIPESQTVKPNIPSSYQTRKIAATAESRKEYYKAQAITLIRQAFIT